ncbi:MAG: preprotein translocase subunit SecG [Pseudomonadota bacterium]|nr:preprotein translocase subunit SecG [Pseudomonadota bacterium]
MTTILLVVHLLLAMALIGVVLMQRSEGGALGIGGGGMGSLFSSRGAANVLTRATAFLAIGFFVTSIALTMFAGQGRGPASVFDNVQPGGAGQGQPANGAGQAPSVLPQLPAPAPSQPQVPVGQ